MTVKIPPRMQTLPLSDKGEPITFLEVDPKRREICQREDLCPCCGRKLFRGRWFVGSAKDVFVERGLFPNLPMHEECMTYSMATTVQDNLFVCVMAVSQKLIGNPGRKVFKSPPPYRNIVYWEKRQRLDEMLGAQKAQRAIQAPKMIKLPTSGVM